MKDSCKTCIFRAKDGYCGYYEIKVSEEHESCKDYDDKEVTYED